MLKATSIQSKKFFIALLLVGVTHIAVASFTGSTEESLKNKYSLKNFNKTFYRNASPFSLRAGFQYKGTQILSSQTENNVVTYNSIMRYERGNTTYIYPYKHTVSIPRFKAPTPPLIR